MQDTRSRFWHVTHPSAIILVGVGLLLLVISRFYHPSLNPMGIGADSYEYWDISSSLLKGQGFAYSSFHHYLPIFDRDMIADIAGTDPIPVTARMPLYPLILAGLRLLLDSPLTAILFNVLFYVGICVFALRLSAGWLTDNFWRKIYAVCVVFCPLYFIRWGVGTEMLASLCAIAFLFHLINFLACRGGREQPLLSLFWAACFIFLRPNGYLIVLLCLAGSGLVFRGLSSWQRRMLAVMLLVTGLLIAGWLIRNKSLTGRWTMSSHTFLTLLVERGDSEQEPPHPLAVWNSAGRGRLFREQLLHGKSFNQAEGKLDQRIKQSLASYWAANPLRFLDYWQDGLRSYFFMSYFELSDLILNMHRPLDDRLKSLSHNDLSDKRPVLQSVLDLVSRIFKWTLAAGFLLFPWLLYSARSPLIGKERAILMVLWSSLALYTVLIAPFAGAVSDRIRMPLYPFYLFFLISSLQTIFRRSTP